MLGILKDGRQGPYSILSYVGMSVVKAGLGGGKEGLDQFWFPQFGQES
jgi:hypothetical protein